MAKEKAKTENKKTSDGYKQTVYLRFLHIAPRKVRRIAETLKGLPINEAEAQLIHQTARPAEPLLKLLRSAAANAKNAQINADQLIVSSARVDQGPMLRRFLPRAQGRATLIQKKMSHVSLTVEDRGDLGAPKFAIIPPIKKTAPAKKPSAKTKRHQEGDKGSLSEPKKTKSGFLKRVFRRKSV